MNKTEIILAGRAFLLRGGQGLNLYHMFKAIRDKFRTTLYCLGASSDDFTHEVHFVPESSITRAINKTPVIRRLRDWTAFIEDQHFDNFVKTYLEAAAIFQGVTGQCINSMKIANKKGARILLDVITPHVDYLSEQALPECSFFKLRPMFHPLHRKRMLEEYERADLIRVMSGKAYITFIDRGFPKNKIKIIQPPINLEEFPLTEFDDPNFKIIFAGLVEPWKGIRYLIEAFGKLNINDCQLIIWGWSGSRAVSTYLKSKQKLNPNIKVMPQEIRQLGAKKTYGAAHVLVHPSVADGFGFVVAEAMASGIPAIVTENTGASELITDGYNGFVIPARDSGAICDRLEYLHHHRDLLRQMGRNARETIKKISFENFKVNYLSVLSELN